jgi:DNA-binding GntR family transcriptional regulator
MKRALVPEPVEANESAPPRTVAELAYRAIRSDILWGHLSPGVPLRFDELRNRYDVGISPLREALTKLCGERLVVSVGQKGFTVAALTSDDVRDTAATRLVIESEALAKSIELGDVHWEMAIVSAFHGLTRHPSPLSAGERTDGWEIFHRQFHMALISACGSRWLIEFASLLFDQAERHRILRARLTPNDRLIRDVQAEHQAIFDAVMARDVARAIEALTRHYQATAHQVDIAISGGLSVSK